MHSETLSQSPQGNLLAGFCAVLHHWTFVKGDQTPLLLTNFRFKKKKSHIKVLNLQNGKWFLQCA